MIRRRFLHLPFARSSERTLSRLDVAALKYARIGSVLD
jgi:hypothetical protein